LIKNSEITLLVRLLNTLIFLKSDVKSRFAGAGFEPRQTAAGLRLTAQPADLVRILLKEQKQVAIAPQVPHDFIFWYAWQDSNLRPTDIYL